MIYIVNSAIENTTSNMRHGDYIVKNKQFNRLGLGQLEFYTHCSLLKNYDFGVHQRMVKCGLLRRHSAIFKLTDSSKYSLLLTPFLLQLIELNASLFQEAFQKLIDCVAGYNHETEKLNNLKDLFQYEVRLGDKIFHLDVRFVMHMYERRLKVLMYYTGEGLYTEGILNHIEFPLKSFMEFLSTPMNIHLYTPYLFDHYSHIKQRPLTKLVNGSLGQDQNDIVTAFFNKNNVRRICTHTSEKRKSPGEAKNV